MASKDLFHSLIGNAPAGGAQAAGPATSLAPATITATTNGSSVDTLGWESLTILVALAAIGGTGPSYAFKVQDSADGSVWADLDNSCYMDTFAPPAAMTANGVLLIGLRDGSAAAPAVAQQIRQFVRAVVTVSGTTPTAILTALVVRGHPRHRLPAV